MSVVFSDINELKSVGLITLFYFVLITVIRIEMYKRIYQIIGIRINFCSGRFAYYRLVRNYKVGFRSYLNVSFAVKIEVILTGFAVIFRFLTLFKISRFYLCFGFNAVMTFCRYNGLRN